MDYDKVLLQAKLNLVYNGKKESYLLEPTIENAMKIYKDVKKYERLDENGNVDYKKEVKEEKYDFEFIFNNKKLWFTSSPNKLHLAHQSLWVNSVYDLLKGEK